MRGEDSDKESLWSVSGSNVSGRQDLDTSSGREGIQGYCSILQAAKTGRNPGKDVCRTEYSIWSIGEKVVERYSCIELAYVCLKICDASGRYTGGNAGIDG